MRRSLAVGTVTTGLVFAILATMQSIENASASTLQVDAGPLQVWAIQADDLPHSSELAHEEPAEVDAPIQVNESELNQTAALTIDEAQQDLFRTGDDTTASVVEHEIVDDPTTNPDSANQEATNRESGPTIEPVGQID